MRKAVQTHLECPECGNKVSIWRLPSRQKKIGHIKHMHCPYCKKVQGFVELRNSAVIEDGWMSIDGPVNTSE